MSQPRLDVKKTYKLFIGGKFPRSESGRYLPAHSASGGHLDNFAHASRKDFRDAVVAARAASGGWGKASAYNRGQILYRAAEMLQNRAGELVNEIGRSTDVSAAKAKREVTLAIDRLVHFAGWTDKYSQVFSSVNPVASAHFNFTTPEPTGVVVALPGGVGRRMWNSAAMPQQLLDGHRFILLVHCSLEFRENIFDCRGPIQLAFVDEHSS